MVIERRRRTVVESAGVRVRRAKGERRRRALMGRERWGWM